jgi:hypothetical protein
MPRMSNKSTINHHVGLLEEILATNPALDVLQQMLGMVQDKLDTDVEEWEGDGLEPCRVCGNRYTDYPEGICHECRALATAAGEDAS